MTVVQGLTVDQATRLEHKERVIERGAQQIGEALAAIRDERLYRENYGTFEDYCQQRWGMTRSYADRQIAAAEVSEHLTPIGVKPNEAQARELAPLRDDPEKLREVYQRAADATGGKPTAAAIREAREPTVNTETGEVSEDYVTDQADLDAPFAGVSDEEIEDAFAAAREQGDVSHRGVVDNLPKNITGLDGKTYARPEPSKPKRAPLPEAFWRATFDLGKRIKTLTNLAADDRLTKNADQIRETNLSDLIRARDELQLVIDQLEI